MTQMAPPSSIRQIEQIFAGDSVAGLDDRQLLERFIDRGGTAGDAAFAALVSRHGPMVLLVCRQVLGDLHEAEDAFQAVFLVLARRALSVRDPDLLANWLHRVAIRTARKAKTRQLRRQRHQLVGVSSRASLPFQATARVASPEQEAVSREYCAALHEEIDRLPAAFRRVVVLCYLEGFTVEEAARRLRCPTGTVRSRMARSRAKLRRALGRRGITAPAAVIAAAFTPRGRRIGHNLPLRINGTRRDRIRGATHRARYASTSASALAQDVLCSTTFGKLRFVVSARWR